MSEVLSGIKVIDVSQVAAVPVCARHLGDFGADVVHVENARTGDSWRVLQAGQGGNAGIPSEINYNWEAYNRNKRSVAIDLSLEEGRGVMYRLVEQADVFLTNFRLWEIERFKVEYETLRKINPRIIYGALTAFGKNGPDRNLPAYDTTSYWARSGLPYALTPPGGAGPVFRTAFGDNVTGLALAFGIMLALYHREKTGVGQEVDVSLLHCGYYQMTFDISSTLATGKDINELGPAILEAMTPEQLEERERLIADVRAATRRYQEFFRELAPNPIGIPYETKDGRQLVLAALHPDKFWPDFCRAVGRPDLEKDPRFNSIDTRRQNRKELVQILKAIFLSKTLAEWRPLFGFMPNATIQTMKEAVDDPQARANGMFVTVDHPVHGKLEVIASPVQMSQTPATYRLCAPEFSQHTEEVLLAAGYTWEQIAALKEKGAIG
jgi:crotonobetainyl-CoA:carnitine CoA-transferase CaiB-like acyl-CoA transferase